MDITVYLPDELGQRAKAADLPFSRLLRGAVEDELERQQALEHARHGMTPQRVEVLVDDRMTVLRFTGRLAATDGELDIFQTDTGRVVLVRAERGYNAWDTTEAFGDWLVDPARDTFGATGEGVLEQAAEALGLPLVVDL